MRIVITGAAGAIGRHLIEELQFCHELRLIDIQAVPDRVSTIADLKTASAIASGPAALQWKNAFKGADAVVHLAANIQATASWSEVLGDNIEATWNVLEAAAAYRVKRVVFASSNWAVKALEYELAPGCYLPNGPKIGSDAAPSPVNPYGLSKAFGETAGRVFVTEGKLDSFVALRIGAFRVVPTNDDELQKLWIGADDMRTLMRRCVEAKFDGFHVVYGVSAQASAPYDLRYTESLLSWKPTQVLP